MLVYPQLANGSISQFPILKKRRTRTILNAAADGSSVRLGDPGGASTEWQLSYSALSDAELIALQQFFVATEGSLTGFTFVDPAANLLAWSEVLNESAWRADPFLTLESGVADPKGGTKGWSCRNSGGGVQALSQTLNAPAGYSYCFSLYVRSGQPSSITLCAGTGQAPFPVGITWSRIWVSGSGAALGESIVFAIEIPAGSAIDVFGPQAEAQSAPAAYQQSTTGGIYEGARLRDDFLSFTTQGINRHSATVNVLYANHL